MKDYDGLTHRDMENLNFLINASPEVLSDWMKSVDQDDLEYADELLTMLRYRLIDLAAERSSLAESTQILTKFAVS